MGKFKLTYKQFGERSILIQWPPKIDKTILDDVLRYKHILQNITIKEKVYVKSAFNSILIIYSFTIDNIYDEISKLEQLYLHEKGGIRTTSKRWKIPVCYDDEFALDIEEMSNQIKLSKKEIIKLHTTPDYLVYFIGFLPGFLYLGGLNEQLHFPRKATPRMTIKKGAVAIGGGQTGIYPTESPGGWNIIGNSPIYFFDVNIATPCFAKPGDVVKFYPISLKEYQDINTLVNAGVYQIESEVFND